MKKEDYFRKKIETEYEALMKTDLEEVYIVWNTATSPDNHTLLFADVSSCPRNCLTEVRKYTEGGLYSEPTPMLEAIRSDTRIPKEGRDITHENLFVFRDWALHHFAGAPAPVSYKDTQKS